jgi:hypothetical protein
MFGAGCESLKFGGVAYLGDGHLTSLPATFCFPSSATLTCHHPRYHQTTTLTVNQHRKRLRFIPARQNIPPPQFSRLRHLCTVKPPTTPPAIVANHLITPISVYVARKSNVKRRFLNSPVGRRKGFFAFRKQTKDAEYHLFPKLPFNFQPSSQMRGGKSQDSAKLKVQSA